MARPCDTPRSPTKRDPLFPGCTCPKNRQAGGGEFGRLRRQLPPRTDRDFGGGGCRELRLRAGRRGTRHRGPGGRGSLCQFAIEFIVS